MRLLLIFEVDFLLVEIALIFFFLWRIIEWISFMDRGLVPDVFGHDSLPKYVPMNIKVSVHILSRSNNHRS